ncbi:MAG: hypothetical protein IJH61_07290 [Eubacteriaceae bacterium]|nr:hypothetical protein [Eubacteriaceae bacterium]
MNRQKTRPSLLDRLTSQSNRQLISDLNYLTPAEAQDLANAIESRIDAGDYSLEEWNSVLAYLLRETPKATPAQAKAALIAGLREKNKDNPLGGDDRKNEQS